MRPDLSPPAADLDLDTSAAGRRRSSTTWIASGRTPRARAGLAVLGALTAIWISTLPDHQTPAEHAAGYRPTPTYPEARRAITGLRLAALDRTVPVFEPRRNLFAFASPTEDRHGSKAQVGQKGDHRQIERTAQPISDPTPDVAVLGIFGPRRLRVGVIKNRGGEGVSNFLEDDVVDGRYRVLEINPKSILLHDTASPEAEPFRVQHAGSS